MKNGKPNERRDAPSQGERHRDWEKKAGNGDRERKLRGDGADRLTDKDATGKKRFPQRPQPS